jgi:hypothetical protein
MGSLGARRPQRRMAPHALARFTQYMRQITRWAKRSNSETTREERAWDMQGWRNSGGVYEPPEVLRSLARWSR